MFRAILKWKQFRLTILITTGVVLLLLVSVVSMMIYVAMQKVALKIISCNHDHVNICVVTYKLYHGPGSGTMKSIYTDVAGNQWTTIDAVWITPVMEWAFSNDTSAVVVSTRTFNVTGCIEPEFCFKPGTLIYMERNKPVTLMRCNDASDHRSVSVVVE
jgi:hypothetical protein